MHWPFLHGIGTLLQRRNENENVAKHYAKQQLHACKTKQTHFLSDVLVTLPSRRWIVSCY